MLPSISYMISRLRMIRSVSTSTHKDVNCGTVAGGCASKAVLLGRTQRTKAFHLLSYLFSVQYYFSSVISNRSRDQPQNSGLSVQRVCPLPVSYISLDPSPFHVLGELYKRTNSSWQQDDLSRRYLPLPLLHNI